MTPPNLKFKPLKENKLYNFQELQKILEIEDKKELKNTLNNLIASKFMRRGAGDTLLAGYIYGKVRGLALADTLAFAGALATHSCTQGRVGKEGDDPRLLEQIVRDDFLPLVKVIKVNQ